MPELPATEEEGAGVPPSRSPLQPAAQLVQPAMKEAPLGGKAGGMKRLRDVAVAAPSPSAAQAPLEDEPAAKKPRHAPAGGAGGGGAGAGGAMAGGAMAGGAMAGGAMAGGAMAGGAMLGALAEQTEARRAWLPAAQATLDALRRRAQRAQQNQKAQLARELMVRHHSAVARLAALARPSSLIPPPWAAQGSWLGAPRSCRRTNHKPQTSLLQATFSPQTQSTMGQLFQSSPARARRALEGDGSPSPPPPSSLPQALLEPPAPDSPNSSAGGSASGGISPGQRAKRKACRASRKAEKAAKAAAVEAKAAAALATAAAKAQAKAAAKAQAKAAAQEGFAAIAAIAAIVAQPN
jgi:hypothetical protein